MLIINFILGLLPIIWLVIALCGLKWPGYKAALGALIIAAVEALTYFGFSMSDTLTSILEGFAFAMWPIVIVIIAAVFTYNLSLRTGSIDMIKKLLTITLSLMMNQKLRFHIESNKLKSYQDRKGHDLRHGASRN